MKAPTITQVRRLHDAYGEAQARWGENNMATVRAMCAFYDAKEAYEAKTGKAYDSKGRR